MCVVFFLFLSKTQKDVIIKVKYLCNKVIFSLPDEDKYPPGLIYKYAKWL